MRRKSEARRQAILDAASQVFRECGFERASMSQICARVGGSKATLYSYFASKEELFFEVMFSSSETKFKVNNRFLDPATSDIGEALHHFGESLLNFLYTPEMMAARRLIIAESGRSELGRLCYARGPKRGEAFISGFLEQAMRIGKLRKADPLIASMHLRGLLESELYDRLQFNLAEKISDEEIRTAVSRAIPVFMAAYGYP